MKTTGRDQVVAAMIAFMLLEREKRLKRQKEIELQQLSKENDRENQD